MKYFTDGDQLVITKDDFINLQESPAVFLPLNGEVAQTVLRTGRIISLPVGDLWHIKNLLEVGGITSDAPDASTADRAETMGV